MSVGWACWPRHWVSDRRQWPCRWRLPTTWARQARRDPRTPLRHQSRLPTRCLGRGRAGRANSVARQVTTARARSGSGRIVAESRTPSSRPRRYRWETSPFGLMGRRLWNSSRGQLRFPSRITPGVWPHRYLRLSHRLKQRQMLTVRWLAEGSHCTRGLPRMTPPMHPRRTHCRGWGSRSPAARSAQFPGPRILRRTPAPPITRQIRLTLSSGSSSATARPTIPTPVCSWATAIPGPVTPECAPAEPAGVVTVA